MVLMNFVSDIIIVYKFADFKCVSMKDTYILDTCVYIYMYHCAESVPLV